MTEDEAKTKWCPHALELDTYSETVAHNRFTDGEPVSKCIGSECMAWRKTKLDDMRVLGERTGYCGLAGKP